MRLEYVLILVSLAFVFSLAFLLVGLVYLYGPLDSRPAERASSTAVQATSTFLRASTVRTTALSAAKTTTNTVEKTTTTTSTTTTTMAASLAGLELTLDGDVFYRADDVKVVAYSEGVPAGGVDVVLDGNATYRTDEGGSFVITGVAGGVHSLLAVEEGFVNASLVFSVRNTSYVNSPEVRTQRTSEERSRLVSEGKTVIVFFDLPNCANCERMRPWLADIANRNRDCIRYELLNTLNEGPRAELKELIRGKSSVSTPVILIEGPSGRYLIWGYHPKHEVEEMIMDASGGGCQVK